ncbi:Crp/Fnr family transcriptional regulator [Campylobacter insulaenigrae]|uniref:Transcriptional regulator, Crp family n=2 Tax=Campylobacter insulaenigrae TaxID=260714 RepID=A0A0A8H1A5_9BACT|nr:Crp/Fnr family transcriptional regulator [Campylobacter insulaenigrae]AJC87727.1 transcriptional regulator, Crp family [Campylobacter insulaenigrae NCTC 12927]MCR6570077.1 Crp/Fnr family transcriptional regulator [Campylobacter insulaenigrae]MCR6571862.1 Crp/Fnr family transcriptional regulator [Campylobacter insulaenigrae]MCR6574506.1 Crp/Fnr family transcriptional regulator [Campylobacter insulaenigrae]MCR6576108.1 Crp/Fnr family transcriptional regulator [Campylobacter insulaenigrae]
MKNIIFKFNLQDADEKLALSNLVIRDLKSNFKVNDECLGLIKIIKGKLRAYILTSNAKEITLFNLQEGDECLICSQCNVDSIDHDVFIQSSQDTSIEILPAKIFSKLKEKYPQVNNYALNLITKRFNILVKVLEQALFSPLNERICNFLKENAINNQIKITHEELANHLGSAREVISRILKELEKNKKIKLLRGKIILLAL